MGKRSNGDPVAGTSKKARIEESPGLEVKSAKSKRREKGGSQKEVTDGSVNPAASSHLEVAEIKAAKTPEIVPSDSLQVRTEKKKDKKRKHRENAGEDKENKTSSPALVQAATTGNITVDVDSVEPGKEKKKKKKSKAPKNDVTSEDASLQQSAGAVHGNSNAQYVEHAKLQSLPQTQIDAFLTTNTIDISDPRSTGFRPIIDFKYLPKIDEQSTSIFANFKSPSPIQAAAWPYLLDGRDTVGVAETGSGKTLAFGVPCMRFVRSSASRQKGRAGIKAVIVSPTRELALQIYEQFQKIAEANGPETVCIYGGVPKDPQRDALRTASIIVATPGRLNDFLQEGSADLSGVGYLVLDEADRMLDKGFENEMRKIVSTIPTSTCQTLMFTATWPASIRELAATFMKDPVRITIGDNASGDLRANTRITQTVEVVDPRDKEGRLIQLLKQHQSGGKKNDRILVFCLYKKEATRVEGFIRMKGFRVAGIHGDMNQMQRTASLEAFKEGKVPLLVATDVAARGLDIPSVKVVINVTFPLTVDDYVHRIGRTGRAGQSGLSITLFTEHDKTQSGALINVLNAANQPVPDALLKFGTTVKKKTHDVYGAFYKDVGEDKKATKITFD